MEPWDHCHRIGERGATLRGTPSYEGTLTKSQGSSLQRSSRSQVLFLIPKNPPPQLDVSFSKPFREFVSYCLQRDPRDVSLIALRFWVLSSFGIATVCSRIAEAQIHAHGQEAQLPDRADRAP